MFKLGTFLQSPIVFQDISLNLTYGQLLWNIVVPILITLIVSRIVIAVIKHSVKKTKWEEDSKARFIRWGKRIIRLIALCVVVIICAQLFNDEVMQYLRVLGTLLTQPLFGSEQSQISLLTILLIIPVFYLASLLAKGTQRFLDKKVLPLVIKNDMVRFSTTNLLRYVFLIIFVFMGLTLIGINLSSVMIIFGLLGIGIGLGLQGTVENLFAGIVVIMTRPIKVGDRVQLGEHLGDVTTIKLLHTIITTITNETLIVPNRELVSQVVHNYTHELDSRVVFTTDIQVSYASDLEKVRDILLEILGRNPYALPDSEHQPSVFLMSFDASGITFRLVSWIRAAHDKVLTLNWVNFEVWKAFGTHGVDIPFPQLDVHLSQDNAAK